jgi:hypothetical protein
MEKTIWLSGAQDYWVFGLCPSSGILKTQKNTTFRKLDLFPSSGEGTGDTYSVGPVTPNNRLSMRGNNKIQEKT